MFDEKYSQTWPWSRFRVAFATILTLLCCNEIGWHDLQTRQVSGKFADCAVQFAHWPDSQIGRKRYTVIHTSSLWTPEYSAVPNLYSWRSGCELRHATCRYPRRRLPLQLHGLSLLLLLFIVYIRQSQHTEVCFLGALNDYEDAWGMLAENRRSEWEGEASSTLWWLYS